MRALVDASKALLHLVITTDPQSETAHPLPHQHDARET